MSRYRPKTEKNKFMSLNIYIYLGFLKRIIYILRLTGKIHNNITFYIICKLYRNNTMVTIIHHFLWQIFICTGHHGVKEVCIYLMLQPLTFVLVQATTVGKMFVFSWCYSHLPLYSYRPPLWGRCLYLVDVTATYLCTRTGHHCGEDVCIYLMLQPLTFVLVQATTVGKRFVFSWCYSHLPLYSYRPPLWGRCLYLVDVTATYLCTRTGHHCGEDVCI